MGFELSKERIDSDAKVKGVWRANPRWDGVEWLIASSSTGKVKRALAETMQPFQESGRQPADEEIAERVSKLVADHILLDWRGDITDGGQPLAYSKEAAVRILIEAEGLREWVMSQADRLDNYRQQALDTTAGN